MKKIGLLLVFVWTVCVMNGQNGPYRSEVLWVTTPDHSNWLYALNEEAHITVALYEYGILQDDLEISYSIGPELWFITYCRVIKKRSSPLSMSIGFQPQPVTASWSG
ncbi:hypothetical protein [Geofilum rubicundum]|uniref:hypothetical protein n=1 Tax=Geofilum rubicundum TaxID=472113 RepID=UPI000781F800|nr:hypothetical protein [Geofilum rubicundum]